MKATFGGGCFWCLDAIYRKVMGVTNVVSGYAGGTVPNPTYDAVSMGHTGHAEVIQLDFDPNVISYTDLLEIFFDMHDPTTLNKQGADVGTQYRSIILYHDASQKEIAHSFLKEGYVTEIKPLEYFYPAEDYHQNYFEKNPLAGYCTFVINPKIKKFVEHHKNKLNSQN